MATQIDDGLWLFDDVASVARDSVLAVHLAGLLGCAVGAVGILRDVSGKPRLVQPPSDLVFSTAHRANVLVIAAKPCGRIGCDVELLREAGENAALDEAVARELFSPCEAAWLRSLPRDAQRPNFFKLWTAKEAVLKADGAGLAKGVSEPDLGPSLSPGEPLADGLGGVRLGSSAYSVGWFVTATKDGVAMVSIAYPEACPIC